MGLLAPVFLLGGSKAKLDWFQVQNFQLNATLLALDDFTLDNIFKLEVCAALDTGGLNCC